MSRLHRTSGEGTVYEERPGTWRAQIMVQGRRVSASGSTAAAARAGLAAKLAQLEAADHAADETTVEGFLREWLTRLREMRLVKPQTWLRYESRTRQYLIPALGHLRLRDLTRRHVTDMLMAAHRGELGSSGPLAPRTVLHLRNLLSGALEAAMDEELIDRNVARGVPTPRQVPREATILSPDQARRLMTLAAGRRAEAAIVLTVCTGMRLGELLGLRRADVDIAAGSLVVRETLQEDYDGSLMLGDPKGSRSIRPVPLPAVAVEALRRHLEAPERSARVLVFPNADGGLWARNNFFRDVWAPLRKDAGLDDMHFHDLRHSANTILRELGVDDVTRARILGHSRVVNNDTYGHTTDPLLRQAAERMNEALRGEEATA